MKEVLHHCIVHQLWLVLPTAWWERLHDWSGHIAFPEPTASPSAPQVDQGRWAEPSSEDIDAAVECLLAAGFDSTHPRARVVQLLAAMQAPSPPQGGRIPATSDERAALLRDAARHYADTCEADPDDESGHLSAAWTTLAGAARALAGAPQEPTSVHLAVNLKGHVMAAFASPEDARAHVGQGGAVAVEHWTVAPAASAPSGEPPAPQPPVIDTDPTQVPPPAYVPKVGDRVEVTALHGEVAETEDGEALVVFDPETDGLWLPFDSLSVRPTSDEPGRDPTAIRPWLGPKRCHADRDGDCEWRDCPQKRDRKATCPLWSNSDDEPGEVE